MRKPLVNIMAYLPILILFSVWFLVSEIGLALENITNTRFLRDDLDTMESSNAIFKMGFFSPANSTNRYVGIWYSNQESDKLEVVWVANRENPITDSTGVFKVSEDGNLQVLDAQNAVFWSSNVSFEGNNSVAQLLDTGNLVLHSDDGDTIIWQSFEHPTDSFLPLMTFTIDESAGNKKVLFRSWRSPSDPSSGNFTVGINTLIPPQVFMWNDDRPYWRNAPWNGNIFIGKNTVLSIVNDNGGKIYFRFSLGNESLSVLQHFVVNFDGNLVQKQWNAGKWEIVWRALESDCNIYGKCGPFGLCSSKNSSICSCLNGFVPNNNEEWSKGNWTNGCVRRTPLQCVTRRGRADEFWKLRNVKVSDGAKWYPTNGVEEECIANEQQQQSQQAKARKRNIILIVIVLIGTVTLAVIMGCVWRWMCQRNDVKKMSGKKTLLQNSKLKEGTTVETGDLQVFVLEKLAIATEHFQEINKLGRGGFGTVYKGRLEDNQEIAVKRLSKASGQGLQEFMNEVLVISKLQHINLIKLLGCCVEGEEKMLVYEFMPNNSLDALLFDPAHQKLLDWKKRRNIILGTCRGLLYLHRDSRLRIIHRDLKASNILLDENLNPKISDFGMARIVGGNQDQADTKRIVGTYGYMSPEYAMEGRFSEKSDVFSLGVLLLEIVSGRRNSSFKTEDSLSLVGHAWKLWNEDNILSLIDPTISESTFQAEILRCIQVGLLCVQELSEDRPSVSMVISMAENEVLNLPIPAQPGFTQRRVDFLNEAQQNGHEYCSVNRVSITSLSAR
ncbi:G-type lectin S-receptor-like serine/threonine-protein kinase At1g11300 isoform X2 [Beta vulgaris subsp. vulgaris]|uniref:G-type lectin S-receptor-like serine/threonine-protein kinase At1g11300 isoform X2 n=1 Tax=Beta vulgaris subsp. vulgaris TaxID=3555 RepID=UPI002036ECAF|nr:G-type lectin S-receptor-like serine/threonine-protein kinase At1g11300 isoform X2 [Beta vulgaris subsp. vulgaris]